MNKVIRQRTHRYLSTNLMSNYKKPLDKWFFTSDKIMGYIYGLRFNEYRKDTVARDSS